MMPEEMDGTMVLYCAQCDARVSKFSIDEATQRLVCEVCGHDRFNSQPSFNFEVN